MAKAFNFSLQRVLDIRQSIENQKTIELSNAQVAFRVEEEKLNHLKEKKETVMGTDDGTLEQPVKIDLNSLKVNQIYLEQLSREINVQTREVKKSDDVVTRHRELLMHARKDKKVLELLKEKYLMEYKKTKNREETKIESEVAIRIAAHKEKR